MRSSPSYLTTTAASRVNSRFDGLRLGWYVPRVRVIVWTTPEEAAREEARYWSRQTVAARVRAVEELRRRSPGIYADGAAPRLERVFSLVQLAPRSLPRRRRT